MNIVLQRDSGQYFYSRIKLALNFRMKKKKLQIRKKNQQELFLEDEILPKIVFIYYCFLTFPVVSLPFAV